MSIRSRLTIYWAGVLSLLLVIASVAVFLLFRRLQWGRLDSALREEADTAAETIAHGADPIQMAIRLSQERDLGPRRRVWVTVGANTIASSGYRYADLPTLERAAVLEGGIVDGHDDIFRYAISPFRLKGAPAYLADGVDARAVRESISRLRTSLMLVLPLLLVSSISIGYWLAGRALAPLTTIAKALAQIKPRDLGRRLSAGAVEDEVGQLIRAINALLERLERASAAERRFAADAAHELRTPLTVLRTGIEVALGRERNAVEYAQALGAALRDCAAVCEMADDLLALSRLDQEASLGREAFDLRALTQEVLDAIEPLTAARRLRIETRLPAGINVNGNRDHLRRVLINMLDNAVKFSPEKGLIRVVLEPHNGRVELHVADSGPGIDAEDLPFIFDRFYRGRNGRSEPGKGLGLSLCREIVELHGGTISASNQPTGGTDFIVTLPMVPHAGG